MVMTLQRCRCGGFTVTLRQGLCSVCLYEIVAKAGGDEDAELCAAIAEVLRVRDDRARG